MTVAQVYILGENEPLMDISDRHEKNVVQGQQIAGNAQEVVAGVVITCAIYRNWGRVLLRLENGKQIVAVGSVLEGVEKGGQYEFSGRNISHPKYGPQFEVAFVSEFVPCNKRGITQFLLKNYSGVGKKTAEKLVEHHISRGSLEVLRQQLIYDPYGIDFSVATKRQVDLSGQSKLNIADLVFRDLLLRLGSHGVRDGVLKVIATRLADQIAQDNGVEHPVREAWKRFCANPYEPIQNVMGYSFSGADCLAKEIGIPKHSDIRLASLIAHLIEEGCVQLGHTYLTGGQLEQKVLEFDSDIVYLTALESARRQKAGVAEVMLNTEERFYVPWALSCERNLARLLSARARHTLCGHSQSIYKGDIHLLDSQIDFAQKKLGENFSLDLSQREALKGILLSEHTVHSITAGPGCGKTALMEVLVQMIISGSLNAGRLATLGSKAYLPKIYFCAPTGKAAKVLNARISKSGVTSTTIHAMLEVCEDGFVYHEGNPLPADIIIIDESSMLDLALANSLIQAAAVGCHLIFLGDVNQLPAVACGNVLADLISMNFDHHRLNKTHRNGGQLLEQIGNISQGQIDCTNGPMIEFRGLPAADDIGVSAIFSQYEKYLSQVDGDYSKVGLLVSRRKGNIDTPGWNTTYLNHLLRHECNSAGSKIAGTTFHIGDRVIIRSNQSLIQGKTKDERGVEKLKIEKVVNGDTGTIERAIMKQDHAQSLESIRIALDDGRSILYPAQTLDSVELAYAITIHSSQGSEYAKVMYICTNGTPSFIHRGTVLTAISRAKQNITVYGDTKTIKSIVAREIPKRNSGLLDWMNSN